MKIRFGQDETCIGQLVVHDDAKSRALRVGWGFDEDLPLRPWPAWHREAAPLPSGELRDDFCLAWAGFYIGWTTVPERQ